MRRFFLILTVALLVATSASADGVIGQRGSYQSTDFSPVIDVLLVRPVSAALTLAGLSVCAVACTFATLTPNGAGQTAEELVMAPFRFTFSRPIGRL